MCERECVCVCVSERATTDETSLMYACAAVRLCVRVRVYVCARVCACVAAALRQGRQSRARGATHALSCTAAMGSGA